MGPTAAGKTALACELAAVFPLEIISVDSAMIYREMDIGTAKPSQALLKQIPHHLIDILDPPQFYSAAEFCKDVNHLSQAISSRGKIPFLVGGTMMYFQALQRGLAFLPEADEKLRKKLLDQAELQGWPFLHSKLAALDPLAAKKIHSHDKKRIQRALEVYYLTGKPLSFHWQMQPKDASPLSFINFSLEPQDRNWLHQRIALRFEQMLAQGFVAEVEQLLQKWQLNNSSPALRTVGYRQVANYLQAESDYETMRQKGIAATRQLAKRQLTWLRHWPNTLSFPCESKQTHAKISEAMKKILADYLNSPSSSRLT